jgi:putative DNA primase/helicase
MSYTSHPTHPPKIFFSGWTANVQPPPSYWTRKQQTIKRKNQKNMNTSQAKTVIDTILKDEERQAVEANLKAQCIEDCLKALKSPSGLAAMPLPPRDPVIGKWFKQGDLGFICGPRGMGKTWLAMFLARKCSEGAGLGGLTEWNIHRQHRVLYLDGEMPLDGIRERDSALTAGPAPGLFYLQHEALFHLTGRVLNLADPLVQAAIFEICRRERIEILFLDNLSCLFSGLRENDADSWDRVLPWLLEMRRNRIAVVFIAHAGRNGLMRGTSRREDAAFWIINLSEPKEPTEFQYGAKFVVRFVKNRNATEAECPPLEWTFLKPPADPKVHVSWKKLSTFQLFRQYIEEGWNVGVEIADELGLSRARISQLAAKAIKEGWLKKSGRNYALSKRNELAESNKRLQESEFARNE